jgi:16S rRNA (guanine527-N7)-methyltransferase
MRRRGAVVKDRIRKRATRAGLELPDRLVDRLHDYLDLLRRWNERMNLTSLDEKDAGLDRLLIEPLVAASHLPAKDGHLIDIGSGGGSPAIPMKLATPASPLVMVEAKTRKAAFLREVGRRLELEDVLVEAERYETLLARPELHEGHDVLTLRAVRIEGRVLRGLQAFLRPGGMMFLFRGGGAADVPASLEPPLFWVATYPLVESLRSRLVVLEKRR